MFGMEMVENSMLIKGKTIARKHKKKRIQKKWLKKYGYKDIPDPKVYVFDGKIIGHPKTLKKIEKVANKMV